MGLGIRKYIASRISKIEQPEVFQLKRWMRLPKLKEETIGIIISNVADSSFIDLKLEQAASLYAARFKEPVEGDTTLVSFPLPKVRSVRYSIPKAKLTPVFFTLPKTETSKHVIAYQNVRYSQVMNVQLTVEVDNVNLIGWDVAIDSLEGLVFQIPDTEDILTSFMPTIEKIDLLDGGGLNFEESEIIYDPRTSFEMEKPEITYGEHNDVEVSVSGPMFYYQDFSFKESKNILIKDTSLDTANLSTQKHGVVDISFLEEKPFSESNLIKDPLTSNTLFRSLEPVYELTDKLKQDILAPLLQYQQEGAEYLFHSSLAFVYDDFELGKEYQCLFALKMLLRIRAVKSVLIVTTRYKEMLRDSRNKDLPFGIWQSGVVTLLSNFSFKYINSANNVNSIHDFDKFINIISYEAIDESFISSKIASGDLNQFDCIIFDDITDDILNLKLFNHINSELLCKYFWFLSDFNNPSHIDRVTQLLPGKELRTLARQKRSAAQVPESIYIDYVMPLDSQNSKIPGDLIYEARSKVELLVESGNIMRIQPAVYQLIHDTQRKTNFNMEDAEFGNKARLLKYNIDRILDRYDRVLIYTQFEDSGLKQLSEFLNSHNIKFMKFDITDSAQTITDNIKRAREFEGKLVFLTNLKQKGLFFKFPNVSHLINFDNWWNPIARQSVEENMALGEEKTVTVYNYYYHKTFEYDVIDKFYELGLRDLNVVSSLTTDNFYNLVSEAIWCDILGVETESKDAEEEVEEAKPEGGKAEDIPGETETEEKEEETLQVNSLRELVNLVELFFSKLNFTAISSQVEILNYSYEISAKYNKFGETGTVIAKCIFAKKLNTVYIKEFIKEHIGQGDDVKIFLITNGEIENPMTVIPHNMSVMDGKSLKSYLKIL